METEIKYIDNLCVKITDGSHFSPEDDEKGQYPMYSVKDMEYNSFSNQDCKHIGQDVFDKLSRQDCRPLKDDIVIAKDGSYLKYVFKVKEDLDACILSSIAILRPNKKVIDPDYFVYLMRSASVKNAMANYVSGSALPRIILSDFKKMKIAICSDLNKQKHIASILSAYDSQIENNQKRIKLLEQMAENLYKEWFVRFRFPGYENAEFEGGVPKEWKQVTLGDYANVIMGQSPESCFYNNDKQGLPFHQGVGSYGDFYLQDDVYSTEGKRIAEANSIIFSVRAPVGRINITLNRIILGRGVAGINAKNGNNAFLLWLLKNKFAKEDIIGNGAIFTSVTKDELLGQKMLIPTKDIEESFNILASNIEKEIRFLTLQKDNLTHQRDLLLPRLMSGKLSI